MARRPTEEETATAKTEHEKNEAHLERIVALLRNAPETIRGPKKWEEILPPSQIPRPTDLAGYLIQAEERGREASQRLRRPWYSYLIPIFGKRRHRRRCQEEANRVTHLCWFLGGESRAVKNAVEKSFSEISLPFPVTTRFEFIAGHSGRVEIDLPGNEVIPKEKSSLTRTGRISYRKIPHRERNEMYAQVVASLGLLYGATALDAAPSLESLLVSELSPAIDPKTGKDTVVCLASILVQRRAISRLRLDRLDPVAALSNFEHRFDVGKGAVLRPVEDLSTLPEEPLPATPARMRRNARLAALPPSAAPKTRSAESTESEVAADALRVAVACARSDGSFEQAEIDAIERLIEDRFSPSALEKKRLELLREELKMGAIDVSRAALRLRNRLGPLERRLLVEGILDALMVKGTPEEDEIRLLESVAERLDLSPVLVREIKRPRLLPKSDTDRERWLSALELPADVKITRELVERSASRILDAYSEGRFEGMGAEFQAMARQHREAAEEARKELIRSSPPEAPEAERKPNEEKPCHVIRHNPDLDEIFGN